MVPTVSPRLFRGLSIASLVMVVLIVATGAAVRLTGSGLGCPDWPTCYKKQVTPQLSVHPLIEFSNRMVTVAIVVVVAATFLAALRRRPFRRDLVWLSSGLVAGVLAEAVIGAIVVYTKLNPYLVMVHFLFTLVLVVDAVVLLHRGSRDYRAGTGKRQAPEPMVWLSRGLLVWLVPVLAAGATTSGAGPHAGNATGQQVAKRVPIALRDITEVHASLALVLVGVTLGMVVALHAMGVPERVRRGGRILLMVLCAQAAVGYSQYFTHLPVALVEIHVIGAVTLVVGFTQFHLSLTRHGDEVLEPGGSDGEAGSVGSVAPTAPQAGTPAPTGSFAGSGGP